MSPTQNEQLIPNPDQEILVAQALLNAAIEARDLGTTVRADLSKPTFEFIAPEMSTIYEVKRGIIRSLSQMGMGDSTISQDITITRQDGKNEGAPALDLTVNPDICYEPVEIAILTYMIAKHAEKASTFPVLGLSRRNKRRVSAATLVMQGAKDFEKSQ